MYYKWSSVERDHDPPSSETTILRRARPRLSMSSLLSLFVGIQAFFALVASIMAQAITSLCRTCSSCRFFFRVCLFARSHSIWLLVARIANSCRYPPLKHLPANPAFITFLTFLGFFGMVMMSAEITAKKCICATWIRAVSWFPVNCGFCISTATSELFRCR